MKVLEVIVDVLPKNCMKCPYITHLGNYSSCKIHHEDITYQKIKGRGLRCKLREKETSDD